MRIALDCRLWNQGGVGRYIKNLVWNLLEIDTENEYVFYVLSNELENIKSQLSKSKTAVIYSLSPTTARWHSLSEQLHFWQLLEKNNFDLVHFPYFSHPILYNKPFVVTIHDLTIMHYKTGQATTRSYPLYLFKRWAYALALQHAIYQSKKIIVPTKFVHGDIVKRFKVPSHRIAVTYEGVGRELLEAKQKPIEALKRKEFFLRVGNFYPHKNVEFLVRSFALAQRKELLVLVGMDDTFTHKIKKLVRELHVEDFVIFLSNPSDGELAYLYTHATALVFPSLFEGFGLPVVEAAYFGCPVVLSDIPVFKEIAPPGTIMFNPHEENSLVKAFEKISKRVSALKNSNYMRQFSFRKMAADTLQVYLNARK